MSLMSRIRHLVFGTSDVQEVQSGRPEDAGGRADASAPDRHSTTGTTPNDIFVGRPAGEDAGYLDTGAEKRASVEDEREA